MDKSSFKRWRNVLIFSGILLLILSLIGIVWGWAVALSFVIGGILFAICCILTYHFRSSYHFNNIVDTNHNVFFAFFTNRAPSGADGASRNHYYRASDRGLDSNHPRTTQYAVEEFTPFHFKPARDPQEEERVVRAILRQVFSDEKDS